MAILGFIVFGLVVGALARLIKPGRQNLSLVATLLLGLAGSVIGGIVASALGTGDIFELNILGAIVAIIAAVLLIGVAEGMSGKKSHATRWPQPRLSSPVRRRPPAYAAALGSFSIVAPCSTVSCSPPRWPRTACWPLRSCSPTGRSRAGSS